MDIFKYKDYLKNLNLIKEADETDTEDEDQEVEDTEEEEDMDIVTNDVPEVYIVNALKKIQRKIESLFENEGKDSNMDTEISDIQAEIGPQGIEDKAKRGSTDKNDLDKTLTEMGCELESSDIVKASSTHKSLVVKFSQQDVYYSLYIQINLKQVLDLMAKGEDLSDESIQRCYIKMKKISMDGYEEIGSLDRNVYIGEIDESLIIELKLELDSVDGDTDEEDLEIEV